MTFVSLPPVSLPPPVFPLLIATSLTDDIIKYISPSLEEYKGCDIIDIHPGACLWSQSLHDALQPRRHLLMEPEMKYFKPFIEPLLQKSASAYRHTTLSGANDSSYFASYKQIFNDEQLLFKREAFPAGDARLRQPNKTLLVTGTLSRYYAKGRQGRTSNVSSTNLILHHMVQASQTNGLFHGYGLVRMLLWNPEECRQLILPDNIAARGSLATTLDVAAELVLVAAKDKSRETVVPGTDDSGKPELESRTREEAMFRNPWVDQLSADATLQEMDRAGMAMPEHRQTTYYKSAVERRSQHVQEDAEKKRNEEISALAVRPLLPNESLEGAIAEHSREVTHFLEVLNTAESSWRAKNLRYRRVVLDLPYQFKFPLGKGFEDGKFFKAQDLCRLGPFMDLWGRQVALEAALCQRKAIDATSVTEEMTQCLLATTRDLRTSYKRDKFMPVQRRGVGQGLIHELHAYNAKVLSCDRRPYEPLAVEAKEFWPPQGQFLLDVQPRQDNMADDTISASEANNTMRRIVTDLYFSTTSSVTTAFDRLGPNAGKDLLPEVVELTDASKGGRLDAEDVAVRLMTPGMIRATTKAYLDWPFRPDLG